MKTAEIIKKYYEAFNSKNKSAMLELLGDEVVHDINQGPRMRGKEAFSRFLDKMDIHYDETLTDIVIMVSENESRASAEFICHGTYKVTDEPLPKAQGQKYSIPVGCFFDIKNGKIMRVSNYYNLNDWIKMVQ